MFDLGGVCVRTLSDHTNAILTREAKPPTHFAYFQAGSPFQAILTYERDNSIPVGYINHCISHSKPDGAWHRLERGEIDVGQVFFDDFTNDLRVPSIWTESVRRSSSSSSVVREGEAKPVFASTPPRISGETLFWNMIAASQNLDPHIFPALLRLRQTGNYIIAALSNTIILPPSSPYHSAASLLASNFDVYISSAHVGFRKPEARIFELAVSSIDAYARRISNRVDVNSPMSWKAGVRSNEIVFLDDIGENCRGGKDAGLRCIKVNIGRTIEAVKELEGILGIDLGSKDGARL